MVKLISILSIACISLSLIRNEDKDIPCKLSVEFTNIRNKEGKLYLFIYNYKNQYPDNPYKYYEIDKSSIYNNRLLVNIPKMAVGKYAISILDDENANDDLDRFLGIPTEGYGFSNNVRPLLSMPKYEELLFDLNKDYTRLKLELQYVL
jgi:uncharacterized protein (DUF2141 family)